MTEQALETVRGVLAGVVRAGRRRLLEAEAYQVLQAVGIAAPRHVTLGPDPGLGEVRRAVSALSSDRVVVKIHAADILHKTEAGGLAFCAGEPAAVLDAARSMLARVRAARPDAAIDGVLLCERVAFAADTPGVEALLSIRQDPAFGPVIVLGLGGLLTEWYGELGPQRSTWVVSVDDPMFGSEEPPDPRALGPGVALLAAPSRLHRTPPFHWPTLWGALRRLATLGEAGLEELEVNPLVARGGEALALDGVGLVAAVGRAPRPPRPIATVDRLLAPRSVAVIGASGRSMNAGRVILQNLRGAERVERLWAVHPKEASIDGVPCVAGIGALPEAVDLAVVSVPAEAARDAIRELVDGEKARSVILIPGGFAETGDRRLADEIVAIVDGSRGRPDGGPVLVGANCLGVVSKGRYNTFFLPTTKLPWSDAPGDNLLCLSQSGAYLVTLGSNLDGVIFPKAAISYGNQMDLTVSDLLEHALGEAGVQVVACYIEGFEPLDGQRFIALVRRHRAAGRAVLVYKAGRTPEAAAAAASHTASLAGDWAVAHALLTAAGAVVAESLDELEDLIQAFTLLYDRRPAGRRVGVISNAGFECSTAMDALGDLVPAVLGDSTRARLAGGLPGMGHADNPIDATPMANTDQFVDAFEALLADPGVDVVVVSAVPVTPALDVLVKDPAGSHGEDVHGPASLPNRLARLFAASTKPVVAAIDSGALYDPCVGVLRRAGVPTWRRIDRAMRAMSRYCTARG